MPFCVRRRTARPIIVAWPVAWLVMLSLPGAALASTQVVHVFPIPGSRLASPVTQITFRGLPGAQLQSASIQVTGSSSGVHTGKVKLDSDGAGGSFLPDATFTPGEVVTVHTSLNIAGGKGGTYTFAIAIPAGPVPFHPRPSAPRVPGDVKTFASRPDLVPTAIRVHRRGRVAPGYIFLAPQLGPVQDGPEIFDKQGQLVWFNPLPRNTSASDFRVQSYQGHPVLTWWQGNVNAGVGSGQDEIYDSSYRPVAAIEAANGLKADLHEFTISRENTALITAYFPVIWNASAVHGSKRELVLDAVAQEIDIPTGLVLFQWDSLDHVPLTASYMGPPGAAPNSFRDPFDYFHLNSIDEDADGNLILSARNTSAVYKVNRQTGAIIWTLGGRHSSFRMRPGASFGFQHDARIQGVHDRFITVFDDGDGPPANEGQSRALKLILNLRRHTAREVAQLFHSPSISSRVEGNFEELPNGGAFVGFGNQPFFTEYNRHGRAVLNGRIADKNLNYRGFEFDWSGIPSTPPDLAAAPHGKGSTVFASWNGATAVAFWRVLGGTASNALVVLRTARKRGFETHINVGAQQYFAVQALDRGGRVLGTSATIRS